MTQDRIERINAVNRGIAGAKTPKVDKLLYFYVKHSWLIWAFISGVAFIAGCAISLNFVLI